jgi:predicted nucleic acid-binding protein
LSNMVLDASVALAWCFPDESSDYADEVLMAMAGQTVMVPAIWPLEIANALLVGERRRRLKALEISRFAALLDELSIVQDTQSVAERIDRVLPVARDCNLAAYDAEYLELAFRQSAPLATLDLDMQKAAKRMGIPRFPR